MMSTLANRSAKLRDLSVNKRHQLRGAAHSSSLIGLKLRAPVQCTLASHNRRGIVRVAATKHGYSDYVAIIAINNL